MSTAIYYFSATGNSLIVAKDLAQQLGAEMIPIAQALKKDEQAYEAIGIVFPVYMFGLPLIVSEFLKKINIKSGTYVFTVATLGGLVGRAHTQAKEILKKRNIELSAGFSVRMPGNYTPLYEAISQEKQKELFEKEKFEINAIVSLIKDKKSSIFEEKPFLINFLLYALLYRRGSAQIPLSAKGFWITHSCTRCGLCEKVCPVQNITLRDGRPIWLNHCQHCMACLQWCPVEAIQYKKSTVGKKRYHHPDVSAQDIIAQK